jgi:hypothetical protein
MKILFKDHPPYFLKLVFNEYEVVFGLNRRMDKIYSVEVREPVDDLLFHVVPKIPQYFINKEMIRAIFEEMNNKYERR